MYAVAGCEGISGSVLGCPQPEGSWRKHLRRNCFVKRLVEMLHLVGLPPMAKIQLSISEVKVINRNAKMKGERKLTGFREHR